MANGLKQLREGKWLTQEELASASGVGVATISRLETGKVRPSIRTIRSIAKVLDIPPDELYETVISGQYRLL